MCGWMAALTEFSTQILGTLTAAVVAVGDDFKSFGGEQLLLQQETDNPDQVDGHLW